MATRDSCSDECCKEPSITAALVQGSTPLVAPAALSLKKNSLKPSNMYVCTPIPRLFSSSSHFLYCQTPLQQLLCLSGTTLHTRILNVLFWVLSKNEVCNINLVTIVPASAKQVFLSSRRSSYRLLPLLWPILSGFHVRKAIVRDFRLTWRRSKSP